MPSDVVNRTTRGDQRLQKRAARELGVLFVGRVPIEPRIVEGCESGRPFVADGKDSPAKEAFLNLTERAVEALARN